MAEPEDFYRGFLPRFIDAQRAFHDGDPEPNLALWSSEDPVTLFAARGLLESGTEPVTAAFRFVASTFSDVEIFDWETLASGVVRGPAHPARGVVEGSVELAAHIRAQEGVDDPWSRYARWVSERLARRG